MEEKEEKESEEINIRKIWEDEAWPNCPSVGAISDESLPTINLVVGKKRSRWDIAPLHATLEKCFKWYHFRSMFVAEVVVATTL